MEIELTHEALLRKVDPATLSFTSTADLTPTAEPLAQLRARDAVEFGVGIRFPGYNLYALGAPATDKRALVTHRLEALAARGETPDDWCYLQNFEDPARPHSVRLPAGLGRLFRQQMQEFVAGIRTVVPAALTSDEFHQQVQELSSGLQERQSRDAAALEAEAKSAGLTMLPTPNGFVFAPVRDGKVMDQEAFIALDDEERQKIQAAIDKMTNRLLERLRDYPQFRQRLVEDQRQLVRRTAEQVVVRLLARMRGRYQAYERISQYLNAVQEEVLDNVDRLLHTGNHGSGMPFMPGMDLDRFLERFNINLLVDAGAGSGSDRGAVPAGGDRESENPGVPVLYESNPSLENLVGKLEHRIEFGTPVTDFNLIRPGALHRANGGYLLLDAERLVQKPFAWEALKRALFDGCVRIESVSQLLNMTYSVSLEPEPIPLDVKVVLLGSRRLYHLLRYYDPDFDELFKIVADFDDDVDWTPDNVDAYANLIAGTIREAGLKHLTVAAVARVLEHSSRLVEDRERLSTHVTDIRDLLREADFIATQAGAEQIDRQHVAQAIEKRIFRLDRFRELVRENVARGLIVVDTSGARVGQINGLSVMDIGQMRFGQPMRITATARLGRGELIDIERESQLGGRIHSKAVMIVSSFVGSRYAKDNPLSLHGTLVFEQSYGGVEGDSASIAEVCAFLSAIIERPILQNLAVTGSMDQYGTVQAIGGVNEKIEGFYDVCLAEALTGDQGVIIPATNRDHLMLREDVVEAVRNGRFHIYTVETVDDALALLFAQSPGSRADVAAIDAQVKAQLQSWHEVWRHSAREVAEPARSVPPPVPEEQPGE